MKHACAVMCVVLAPATSALAQQPAPALRHLVGRSVSEQLPFDTRTQTTAATATLTFTSTDGGPTLTIDFLGQYKIQNPRTPPTVVDIVVNEHPADEDTPALRLQADGESVPLIARFRSARAVVSTISFDQFVNLTNAGTLVEQAFGCELEFSQQQLRMLRFIAQRWADR